MPGIAWKLIDADGKEVPKGEAGEFIVKGDNIMLGYWNLPDATKNALRGGWLHTGDVAAPTKRATSTSSTASRT